jgi:serine/threonine protein kinase/Tol biopolymer transport system component
LGPYQIVSQIGAGGMGEVYKATDTRLHRTVAVKILPEHLAGDPERLARFRREAQTISSLNHPHICALYDVGDENGMYFLVMEYVEGESLDKPITRGTLRLDDCLEYARQIADALKTAHEHGIVHRDLKPGNVMVTTSGVKLLDFGLAKFNAGATGNSVLSQLPTQGDSRPLTGEGTILGTFRYMAPEQLEGKEVDARTDLYALCLILYEMIAGKRPFDGATQASLIAAILKDSPRPLADFQPVTPPLLDSVVQIGLAKDPDKRWQSARELKHALEWIRLESRSAPPAPARVSWLWKGLVAVLAVALVAALLVPRPARIDAERRLEIWTGESADPTGFAVSPDGGRIVYVASGPAGSQLWLRPLNADHAEPLAQTLGASHPFWSPDSQSIGFFAERQLKRFDVVSRATTPLSNTPSPQGGAWGADGILFTPHPAATVVHIPAGGGEPTPVVTQPPGSNLFPVFLGEGPAFVFRPIQTSEIRVASIGSPESRLLLRDASAAALHPSGYLFFIRQDALLAQRFDKAAGAVVGNEVAVTNGVLTSNFGVGTALSVSASGVVAYRRGQTSRQLAFFDRSGKKIGEAGVKTGDLRWPGISRQGRVALQSTKDFEVWLINTDKSAAAQLTFSPGPRAPKIGPVWSSDGLWVAFVSLPDGSIRRKRSNGTGDEEILFRGFQGDISDWSPDGKWMLLSKGAESTDISVLSLEGKRELAAYLANPAYSETRGAFSPNGRWVAYESNESGRFEIYVRPFPNSSGSQSKVSSDGGSFARWSSDGRELFYLSPSGVLMAVPVNITGDVFNHGAPHELFRTRIAATEMADVLSPYNVTVDGRFLMRVPGDEDASPITVLLNWSPERK